VGQIRLALGLLLAVSAFGADSPLDPMLKGIEQRYNKAKTLQVLFKEVYMPPGKARRSESGLLMLRKPGKMRWQYNQPAGKLFISDGKWLWLYTPEEKRAEKMKFKETDDLRAPLAFLLGKLDFDKEFHNIQGKQEAGGMRISAEPKTDNLPYSAVEFLVAPGNIILEVKVTTFDKAVLQFTFEQERMDPPLDNKLFNFQVPKGVELVEASQ
jgi:outer membrane lipoprotein carrier protein